MRWLDVQIDYGQVSRWLLQMCSLSACASGSVLPCITAGRFYFLVCLFFFVCFNRSVTPSCWRVSPPPPLSALKRGNCCIRSHLFLLSEWSYWSRSQLELLCLFCIHTARCVCVWVGGWRGGINSSVVVWRVCSCVNAFTQLLEIICHHNYLCASRVGPRRRYWK